MLSHQLLKNHAGILLIGDYTSLRWLHEVLHDINERSPLVKDREGPFLSLAYDVRKAYEQQREVLKPPKHYKELGIRYGVQVLWPVLLLQQRMLRVSLGYLDHSHKHQAITYALEGVIDEAVREDFGAQAQITIDRWQRLNPADPALFEKLDSRGAIFCSWTKAQRHRLMIPLLETFDPLYETLFEFWIKNGDKNLLPPEGFVQWANIEWPDPNW